MTRMNVQKGRAMLNWGGVVLGETLTSYESLKDGRIFCRMLNVAQRSIDDDSDLAEEDDSNMSLQGVYNVLSTMFTEKVMKRLDLDLAAAGDELELAKFLLLVLAAGVKSPLGRCFMSPSFTLDLTSQNLIMSVMGQAFKGCSALKQLSKNFYDGLLDEQTNETIESPQDASTPVTPKVRRNVSAMSPAGSVAAACGSPSLSDKSLDKSITTMLKMRQHRICQFEQKLAKEKLLRNEIEAELQLKDDMLESKIDRIKELEQKISTLEKLITKMKTDQSLCWNELSEFKKTSHEQYLELQTRYEGTCKDLQDFKARSEFLEKDNAILYEELHKLRKLQAKLDQYKGIEEALTKSNLDNSELRAREANYNAHLKELQEELDSLRTAIDNERECYREKMNTLQIQNEKSWLPESAECLGDILQDDLKENIKELQRQLQDMENASEELKVSFSATNTELRSKLESLSSEKMNLQEDIVKYETKIHCLLEEASSTNLRCESLQTMKSSLERCILEKEEALKNLKIELENLKIDSRREVEYNKELEKNIKVLEEELLERENTMEKLKCSEAQLIMSLQEFESKYKNSLQELDEEKLEKSKVEEFLMITKNENEVLARDLVDLNGKLNSLSKNNEMLMATGMELKEQIVIKDNKISTLEADLSVSKESYDQLLRESSESLKEHAIEMDKKEQEVIELKGEIKRLESLLGKLKDELKEKDVLICKNEASAQESHKNTQAVIDQLKDSEYAYNNLLMKHDSLNREALEVKAQLSCLLESQIGLENNLKSKSMQLSELEERLSVAEQKLIEERICFDQKESSLKSDLEKAIQSQENIEHNCCQLEARLLEQTEIMQKVEIDSETAKVLMRKELDEALKGASDLQKLNRELNGQVADARNEQTKMMKLFHEQEQNFVEKIKSLEHEKIETAHKLLRQGCEINELLLQKKKLETDLDNLKIDLASMHKSSESEKNVSIVHKRLIKRLEDMVQDNMLRIDRMAQEFEDERGKLNQDLASAKSQLAVAKLEKNEMNNSLKEVSAKNEELLKSIETLESSHAKMIVEIETRSKNKDECERRQFENILKDKDEQLARYREKDKCFQEAEALREEFEAMKEEGHVLNLELKNATDVLCLKAQEVKELRAERNQISEQVLRLQGETDTLKKEIQDNNEEIRRLRDRLAATEAASNRFKSNDKATKEISSLLSEQRDSLSLSRSSSVTCTNEVCLKTREWPLENTGKSYLGLNNGNDNEEVTSQPSTNCAENRVPLPAGGSLSDRLSSNNRHVSDFGVNFQPTLQNLPLATSTEENRLSFASEKRHSLVISNERSAAFSALPRMMGKRVDKEGEQTVKRIPKGLGVILKSEDEPDHMEWGLVEKQQASNVSADTMFGGAKLDSTTLRRMSFSNGSNASHENSTSRKHLLGTSCTTFSSFHPTKQEAFGLHSIAEDDTRVEEIKRRNTLCLPHLKSSYPLEELHQMVSDEELKKPRTTNDENVRPAKSSYRDKRKSPRKKFSFNSTISPSAKRSRELRSKVDTPTKRSYGFGTTFLSSDHSSLKSDPDSSIVSNDSTQRKTKSVAYSIGFTPKKAFSKLGFNKKKKEDK